MDISVNIKKKDLLALNLYLLPRRQGYWLQFTFLTGAIFAYILIARKTGSAYDVAVAIFAAFAGGVGGLFALTLFSTIEILLTVGTKNGVLGVHHYALLTQGLQERTDANESLQSWDSVESITKLPNYIFFRVRRQQHHTVPRRAFSNNGEFNLFYERAVALHQAATR